MSVTEQPTRLGDAPTDEPAPPTIEASSDTDTPVDPASADTDEAQPVDPAGVDTDEAQPVDPATSSTDEAQPVDPAGADTDEAQSEDPARADTDEAQPADPAAVDTDEAQPAGGATHTEFWRRRSTVVAAAVLGGVLLLYLGAYLVVGTSLASGATVLGIEVGGLSKAEAEAKLAAELPALVDAPISVRVADDQATFSVAPPEAGLAIDVEATVDAVPRASANPLSLLRALLGVGEIDPVPAIDRGALESAITAIAEQTDTDPVNGSVGFKAGAVVTSAAVPGRALDVPAAADAVEAAFFGTEGPYELPLPRVGLPASEVEAAVSDADVERAVTEFAEPAMSAPVTVVGGDQTAMLEPAMVGAALSMVAGPDGTLTPKLDGAELAVAAEDLLAEIGQAGKDATIVVQNGRPVVIPAQAGLHITPDELAAAILPALTAAGDARTANVTLTKTQPELTTRAAHALGVNEVVSEFTTHFPHAAYRNVNIARAAEKIDDTLLLPGETFSLNAVVGERTVANGFTVGYIIDGGRLREDLGGGVSQVATTTYNAGFFAGLKDVEHKPHGFYISRYPMGREATVAWPSLDMAFQNDTPYGVLIQTIFSRSSPVQSGSLTVRIWSTEYYEVSTSTSGRSNIREFETIYDTADGCVAQDGVPGFDVTVYRTVTLHGEVVKDEAEPVHYQPAAQIHCNEKPKG